MARLPFPLAASLVVAATSGVGWGVGTWKKHPPAAPTPHADAPPASAGADRGPLVFQVYCASCHGPDGHGDGASAAALRPPPRDFAARPWRFEPTPESIRRVTLEGIPGTGMASFRTLPPADLDAVAAHVHRLATNGPAVEKPKSEDEQMLAAAGFADLSGTAPPPLLLTDAANKEARLSDFAGRLVVLHFWGTGCVHCVKEIPALDRLERQFAGRLKVLHVCTDEDDPAAAQKVLDRAAPGATALTEANGLGLARYEVQSLPTVWLIAPDGKAIGRGEGAKDWADEAMTKLIARRLPPTAK